MPVEDINFGIKLGQEIINSKMDSSGKKTSQKEKVKELNYK